MSIRPLWGSARSSSRAEARAVSTALRRALGPDVRGQVLLIVLIILTLSTLVAIPTATMLSSTLQSGLRVHQDYQAQYSRDAGVEYAIATLKNNQATRVTLSGQAGVPLALTPPPTPANGVAATSLQATLLTPSQWSLVRAAPDQTGLSFARALSKLTSSSPESTPAAHQLSAWAGGGGPGPSTRFASARGGRSFDPAPVILPRPAAATVVTISKTVSPAAVTPGGQVTYTITITNAGGEAATVTHALDTLPTGFSYILNSTTGGLTSNPKVTGQVNLDWSPAPSIPIGGSLTFSFSAVASSTPGTYYNVAQAQGSNFSTTSTGNTAPVIVGPTLTITKTVSPSVVVAGSNVTYTVTVTNTNPGTTGHTTAFFDNLPAGFAYVTGSTTGAFTSDPKVTGSVATGQTLEWDVVRSIPYGTPLSFSFQAASSTTWGQYFNIVQVQGNDFATVSTGLTAAVTTVGAIQITKTVDNSNALGGDTVTYTVTTSNVGGTSISITRFQDTLPQGFTYVTGSTSGAMTVNPSQTGGVLTWSGAGVPSSIAGGAQIVFSFQLVTTTNPGDYDNNASVTVVQGGTSQSVTTGDTARVSVSSNPVIVISETQGDTSGPMGWSNVYVTGYNFRPNTTVKLFWHDLNNPLDTTVAPPIGTDLLAGQTLITLSSSYRPLSWSPVQVTIPSNANWGNGFIVVAEQRSSNLWVEVDRKAFNVRAKYLITSQTVDGRTLTARVAFTGAPSPDKQFSTPTNTPVITIYDWKEQ
ncbi:MAG: DUF11 domain-containing protein [Chloroflexi bacterium]|nr:DUF11 domain-containing protein [Chloroflexota bacterium]